MDEKGKQRKRYPYEVMMTPYEKLTTLDNWQDHLKPDITAQQLEAFANKMTGNEAAERLETARYTLFRKYQLTGTENSLTARTILIGHIHLFH